MLVCSSQTVAGEHLHRNNEIVVNAKASWWELVSGSDFLEQLEKWCSIPAAQVSKGFVTAYVAHVLPPSQSLLG